MADCVQDDDKNILKNIDKLIYHSIIDLVANKF